jgi:purine-nucleoside phosphorylase
MSTHIGASPEIAQQILLPGDPLRAEWIAQAYLDDAQCYSRVRGMLGFTGTCRGVPVSVQGTGMGMPSPSIYVTELIEEYGARTLIRVGSCGSMQADLGLLEVVIATSACTDSAMDRVRFRGIDFAPTADFSLLRTAHDVAVQRGVEATSAPSRHGTPSTRRIRRCSCSLRPTGFSPSRWKRRRSTPLPPAPARGR